MLRERKIRVANENHDVVNVKDDDDDDKRKKKNMERRGSRYAIRCCVVSLILLFLLSLYIYPGDAFIKNMLEHKHYWLRGQI